MHLKGDRPAAGASARSRKPPLFLITCALLALAACDRAPTPTETIQKAYEWYVQTLKSGGNPFGQARAGLSSLATEAFLSSIENIRPELENNPFTDPETFDARIGVENVTTNGPTATARVIVAGRTLGKRTLHVYLKKEDRRWKIDDVKLLDQE